MVWQRGTLEVLCAYMQRKTFILTQISQWLFVVCTNKAEQIKVQNTYLLHAIIVLHVYLHCSRSVWLRVGAKRRTHMQSREATADWTKAVCSLCVIEDETTQKMMLPLVHCPAHWEETATDKSNIVHLYIKYLAVLIRFLRWGISREGFHLWCFFFFI